MGIRFACHHCNHPLNLKDFQAGKRGKCPACSRSFRIPRESCDFSIPLEEANAAQATSAPAVIETKAKSAIARSAMVSSLTKTATKKSELSTKPKQKIVVKNRPLTATTASVSPEPASEVDDKLSQEPIQPESPVESVKIEETSPRDKAVAAFDANPLAQWYVRPPSGGQYGPADSKLLAQWISENRVTADSLIWFDGLTQWTAAGSVLAELFNESGLTTAQVAGSASNTTLTPVASNMVSAGQLVGTASIESVGKPIRSRQKQKRNQWIVITLLISVCFCLILGLVAVLLLQK
ncbi:DUF4339 domain-containing protein [Pirellulaceae bacterium SH449]